MILKKFGIAFGVLTIVLISIALIAPGFVDWNKYKSEIEQKASELSGRTVAINGELSLSILPSPSFSAENVRVSNVEGGQAPDLISLKSVDVNVAFFPLLKGQIQVKKFILVEPIIALEIDDKGRGNWEFGTQDEPTEKESNTTELSFERFQIENGQISFQDFTNGNKELVRMINASVTMGSLQGPFEVVGDAKYKDLPTSVEFMLGRIRDERKVPVSITIGLLDDKVKTSFIGGVLFDEGNFSADGKLKLNADDVSNIAQAASLLSQGKSVVDDKDYNQPISLESNLAVSQKSLALDGLEFEMGESRGSANLFANVGEVIDIKGDLSINSINLDLILPLMTDKKPSDTSAVKNANLSPETDDKQLLDVLNNVQGSFNLKLGALRFNEKIASQLNVDIGVSNNQINISNAKINMPGGSDLSLSGVIREAEKKPEFNGNIDLNSGNFRAFLDWLKIDTSTIPAGRLTHMAYSGGIKADRDLIQIYQMNGSLDTLKFTGGISYALQERPAYGLDINIQNLNIDNYLVRSAEPINLKEMIALLNDFDANYKLNLTNLTFDGVTVKNINLAGDLFGGRLNAQSIKVADYAGIDMNGSVNGQSLGSNPQFNIKMNATAASLVPMQRAFKLSPTYDLTKIGTLDLTAGLSGSLDNIQMDITSTIGTSKADVKGKVSSVDILKIAENANLDLVIKASNSSLVSLINQFDLALNKPANGEDRAIGIDTSFKGSMNKFDLNGTLSIAGGTVSIKGNSELKDDKIAALDMTIDIASPQTREFVRGLGVDFNPAKSNLGPLKMTVSLSGAGDTITLTNIAGNVSTTKLNGTGKLVGFLSEPTAGKKPNFDLNLTLDSIILQDFMRPDVKTNAKTEWGNWSKEPMELAVLNDYEGQAVIKAQKITYKKYDFNNPQFQAVLKDGTFKINNFTGKLFGGDVSVAGSLNSVGDLDMDLSLKQAAVKEATSSFAGISPISGFFDMNQKITGKGKSQNELISSLSGGGSITASPGIIQGIDIPTLSEKLKGLSNKNGLLGLITGSLSGGQTAYDGGQGTITAKNGAIQLSPLDVKMRGAKSVMNLGVDLAQWKMNLAGDMSLNDHPGAPPIGINVTGDLHDPSIKYNTKALEGFITAKIAASLLQNMVEGNGGIGGIFGGTPAENQPPVGTQGTPPVATPPAPVPPASEGAPVQQDNKPATVEDLGAKLLEKLFQKPAQPPQ